MDKYIGRLLDNRYEILEVIGTGGMAVVYKARCHRLNRLVAIKILKDDYSEDDDFRRRFHTESQAVAMLSHPNIVSVYDVSTSVTADYIVMELIDGITLKQYMEKKGVLNWKETLHFAIQIAKALEHAHSRGIVHRDIKPHNVMVLKNGSVKVTDFGIARMMSKGNTLTKEALGSVHYISPEQAKGGRVDSRSDIYSLGVVMYEMMSGRPPYDGESPVSVAIQHINGGAKMPSTLNPNIPGGLEQIIMKAMAHEPAGRFPSATAMLVDLDEFRKNPGILFDYHTPPTDAVTNMKRPPLVLEPMPPKPKAPAQPERRTDTDRHRSSTATSSQRRSGSQNRSSAESRAAAARRRAEAEAEQKRSKVATVAIVLCSLVMVTAIVIFLVVLLGGGVTNADLVEVPDLVGKVYRDLPDYANFEIKLVSEVHNDEYEAGKIIDQEPAAGKMVKRNQKIYLTVSLGKVPADVLMPHLGENMTREEAERTLNNLNLNLNITVTEEYSSTVKTGCVVRTNPIAGTELSLKQNVILYVSKGPQIKTSTMPPVTGYNKDQAVNILNDQNLNLEIVVEEVFHSTEPVGIVIRSDPASGDELKTGQKVTLYVSKGPELKAIPEDIVGKNIMEAVGMLAKADFSNYKTESVKSEQEEDTVIELRIGDRVLTAGEVVDVNAEIIIVVSKSREDTAKTITIKVPSMMELWEQGFNSQDYSQNGTVSFVLVLQQGSTVYYTSEPLNFTSEPISVTLNGTGIQVYELLVNGKKYSKIEVDFTA